MRIFKSHPLLKLANSYMIDSPQPSNISFLWNFGSLLGFCLVIQIITGVTLAMHYNANVLEAFNSVEHVMRDVNNGWLIRYLHSNTASAFFFIVYLHIGRGLYYGCAPCRGIIVVKQSCFYQCLKMVIATELGLRENRKLNIASLSKQLQLLTHKVILELWAIYSMVKAILHEANCLLASSKGHYHYGEGIFRSKERVDPYRPLQTDSARCEIITLKDKSLQPKEYVRTIINTTGLPKESNLYGNRVTILGKTTFWSVTANKRSNNRYYSTSGTNNVESKLEKLRFRSEMRPKHSINKNLHSMVYDVDLLHIAYDLLKSKSGNMTPGIIPETLHGMSQEVLLVLSEQLKNESFQFKPSKRVYIPKASGGLRPLSIAPPRDKIVQQAIKSILESIFEPIFLECSHGFRPNRSCHTALNEVRRTFTPSAWVIEGDIEKCFDSIDHSLLMAIIEAKILDRRFTNLIRKALKAGYLEFNVLNTNIAGTPQGSIVSPILANIFLHQLDVFIESLIAGFNKGNRPGISEAYKRIRPEYRKAIYHNDITKVRNLTNIIKKIDYTDYSDPNYKRLTYVRYADDWLVGVRGSYNDALEIKSKITEFCREISLKVSESKTKITSLSKDKALFLGVHITRSNQNTYYIMKRFNRAKRQALQLRFQAPIQNIVARFHKQGFMKDQKPIPKFIWMSNQHRTIIGLYNSMLRGYLNYYSFVNNYGPFVSRIMLVLKSSCCKLLAAKYSMKTMASVYKKFGKNLTAPALKDREKPLPFVKPSYKLTLKFKIGISPVINTPRIRDISKASLQGLVCQVCGSDYRVEMHHIRKMKDLNPNISFVDKLMAKRNRKQIPLCRKCHMLKHHNK